ncbi:hypothetical protein HMPREF1987_00168 [Peptostreptococcaceae bacterium oral taxon 113 str. W5053]|nr:hypothetical protein HMPREF1987_00168 [Peptostreptococcaceae bacterium oral taxon 113 str. W5053]
MLCQLTVERILKLTEDSIVKVSRKNFGEDGCIVSHHKRYFYKKGPFNKGSFLF